MEIKSIVLSVDDIEIITELLCECEDTDIADSTLTDFFIILSKEGKDVEINFDDVSFANKIQNVLDEIEFDDLAEDEQQVEDSDDYWSVSHDCWETENHCNECTGDCDNCDVSCDDCDEISCPENEKYEFNDDDFNNGHWCC